MSSIKAAANDQEYDIVSIFFGYHGKSLCGKSKVMSSPPFRTKSLVGKLPLWISSFLILVNPVWITRWKIASDSSEVSEKEFTGSFFRFLFSAPFSCVCYVTWMFLIFFFLLVCFCLCFFRAKRWTTLFYYTAGLLMSNVKCLRRIFWIF